MAEPEKPSPEIPLQEAVARDLIPCAMCGARGADVKPVEGKPHFLCARCDGSAHRTKILLAVLALVALGGALWLLLRPDPSGAVDPSGLTVLSPWDQETIALMQQEKYSVVVARSAERLKTEPENAGVHGLMGRCLTSLSRHEEAIPYFRKASELDLERRASWAVWMGLALQKIGHSAAALGPLQVPTPDAYLERLRREGLLECLIDLERFDEALQMVDPQSKSPGHLRVRHRIFCYQGKTDEARKLLEGLDIQQRGSLRASELREAGDFAGAFREVDALKAGHATLSARWVLAARSELSICLEAKELERLERVAVELARATDPQPRGTAILYRFLGRLVAGKPDEAKAVAKEFLAAAEPTYSPLRLERMMMRHLLGELKTEDLEAEAKKVSRFLSNDLYWYLALATGDKAWAKKAADATPARNFPYHSIQRLLKE